MDGADLGEGVIRDGRWFFGRRIVGVGGGIGIGGVQGWVGGEEGGGRGEGEEVEVCGELGHGGYFESAVCWSGGS